MKQGEKLYIESLTDKEIVNAILERDTKVTRLYLYEKCYPLFKAICDKYYTDCENYIEFINEIYVIIMTSGKESECSPLSTFGFRCTLTSWLKIVAENYCRQIYKKKICIIQTDKYISSDSFKSNDDSIEIDLSGINSSDLETILSQIQNERYRNIIKLRHIECRTHEETAGILNMTMANYYNKHKIAKEQFINALKEEGLL